MDLMILSKVRLSFNSILACFLLAFFANVSICLDGLVRGLAPVSVFLGSSAMPTLTEIQTTMYDHDDHYNTNKVHVCTDLVVIRAYFFLQKSKQTIEMQIPKWWI